MEPNRPPSDPQSATQATQATRALITRTQSAIGFVRAQVERVVGASRDLLQSEDARYRALVIIGRFTAHSAIVFVLVLAIILAGLGLGAASRGSSSNRASGSAITPITTAQAQSRSPVIIGPSTGGRLFSPAGNFQPAGESGQDQSVIVRNVVFDTTKPVEVRTGIITYTVRAGDNVETIAQRFGLLPTTIVWSNKDVEDNPDILRVGQELNILPIDGIWYSIQSDDTLSSISEKFKANVADIVGSPLNQLTEGSNLLPGTKIVIPGGVKPFVPKVVTVQTSRAAPAAGRSFSGAAPSFVAGGSFGWPTRGYVTQGYWYGHRGIDIANAVGIPIAAADGGYVTYAGWSPVGYGYMVQIDHGNGFSTLYAHLSQWYVDPGQAVARGQIIGAMGSTGNSTGPHLHFEIRYGGGPANPLVYLP
jgi:murein DD-endopeptidase MepM/ murein hydrolase activator NlpD